ncbi:MAG: hypothetical protein WC746_02120 [archaeon]|jgi:hypothetical protein
MHKALGKKDVKLFYNQIELLVHPFFSLEMIRDKGTGEMLTNASVKLASEAYTELGIINNWKHQLEEAKKNPNAIVILVGIKEKERATPKITPEYFFQGGLTKTKLSTFTQEYQNFLHEAKKQLGKRMIYITQGGPESIQPLAYTLGVRSFAPARNLQINAYGEYHKRNDPHTCVHWVSDNMQWVMDRMQKVVYPDGKVKTTLRRFDSKGKAAARKVLSLGEKGSLYVAAAKREFRRTGRVSPSFVRKHRRFAEEISPKREAKNFTAVFRKRLRR